VSIFKCHDLPPGLKVWIKNNFWWVVCNAEEKVDEEEKRKSRALENSKEQPPKSNQGVRRKKVPSEDEDSLDATLGSDENGASQGEQIQSCPSTEPGTSVLTTTDVRENKRLRLRSSISQSP